VKEKDNRKHVKNKKYNFAKNFIDTSTSYDVVHDKKNDISFDNSKTLDVEKLGDLPRLDLPNTKRFREKHNSVVAEDKTAIRKEFQTIDETEEYKKGLIQNEKRSKQNCSINFIPPQVETRQI